MRAPRDHPQTRPGLSPADRERLARRYPKPRVPKPVVVGTVVVIAGVFLGWLIWTALAHSRPPVSARVAAYTVVSDNRIEATVTVDRSDPSLPVTCRISAQAADFQPVGEVNLPVEATTHQVVNIDVSIKTLRKATTAVVQECEPA